MSVNNNSLDIRSKFINFFKKRGHLVYKSASLIPDDNTIMFTNAGMVPFKDIFASLVPPPSPPRAVSCQLCIRAGGKHNDLENVGYTRRHHTLFEMLGNFSFGDYFKKEAIEFSWEFVLDILKLPKDRLWISIHKSDKSSMEIWKNFVDKDRIKAFGDDDNFWKMGNTGPCGPCSEIFYDQGENFSNTKEDYFGGNGDRFLEVWNLVFMEYVKQEDGSLVKLSKPSIDTGMGLERILAIKEGADSNYGTSIFMPIIQKIQTISKRTYTKDLIPSFRVIADHIRSVSFLIAYGVSFSNEGRGYVLRRILRRAVRHGYLIGIREPFMFSLVPILGDTLGSHFPYILRRKDFIQSQIYNEEKRFFKTIASGLELFERELKNVDKIFSGDIAFKLYDTFGFPLDLTMDMLRSKNINIDTSRFNELMSIQKRRSKSFSSNFDDKKIKSISFRYILENFNRDNFIGYEILNTTSKILVLLDEEFQRVQKLEKGHIGWVFLDRTPFYSQGGGQIGDIGFLGDSKIIDTKRFFGISLSKVETKKTILLNDKVKAKVYVNARAETSKHHTATHLLNKALRVFLGKDVNQSGSLVDKNRLRFDFSFHRALTNLEISSIEDYVNSIIFKSIDIKISCMSIDDAKNLQAEALFEDKYSDEVRVVEIGDVSIELCGGTHVKNSSQIGSFFITKQSSVSAGIRRIEAVCGASAYSYLKKIIQDNTQLKNILHTQDIISKVQKIQTELKSFKRKDEDNKRNSGTYSKRSDNLLFYEKDIKLKNGDFIKILIKEEQGNVNVNQQIDNLKSSNKHLAIMVFKRTSLDKISITSGAKNVSIKANEWIGVVSKAINGKGGGRDDFAQGGAKADDRGIKKAFECSILYAKSKLD